MAGEDAERRPADSKGSRREEQRHDDKRRAALKHDGQGEHAGQPHQSRQQLRSRMSELRVGEEGPDNAESRVGQNVGAHDVCSDLVARRGGSGPVGAAAPLLTDARRSDGEHRLRAGRHDPDADGVAQRQPQRHPPRPARHHGRSREDLPLSSRISDPIVCII